MQKGKKKISYVIRLNQLLLLVTSVKFTRIPIKKRRWKETKIVEMFTGFCQS